MKKKLHMIIILLSVNIGLIITLMFVTTPDDVFNRTSNNTLPSFKANEADQVIYSKKELHNDVTKILNEHHVQDDKVTIIYERLSDRSGYRFNADQQWFAASTYKLPLAVVVFNDINNNKYKLEDRALYKKEAIEDGPINNHYAVGEKVPIKTLLYNAIVYSDNAASLILVEHIGGWIQFQERASELINFPYNKNHNYENEISPRYTSKLLNYMYKHKDEYTYLMELLSIHDQENSTFFKNKDDLTIYSKTGWYNYHFHELALVDGEHPFTLVIFYEGYQNDQLFTDLLNLFISYSDAPLE